MKKYLPAILAVCILFCIDTANAHAASGEYTARIGDSISILNSFPLTTTESTQTCVGVDDRAIPDNAVVTKVVFKAGGVTTGSPLVFGVILSTQASIVTPNGNKVTKHWGTGNATTFTAADLGGDVPAKGEWCVSYFGRNLSDSLPGLKSHKNLTLEIFWSAPDDGPERRRRRSAAK